MFNTNTVIVAKSINLLIKSVVDTPGVRLLYLIDNWY